MRLPSSVLQVDSLHNRDGHCFSFLNNCREKRIKEKPAFFAGNFCVPGMALNLTGESPEGGK